MSYLGKHVLFAHKVKEIDYFHDFYYMLNGCDGDTF